VTSKAPQRIQHHRGKKLPPGAKYVGRPSRWGSKYVFRNADVKPGRVLVPDRATVVARYEADLRADPERLAAVRDQLRGHDLACYCPLDLQCHADVLLRIANE
jgi:hypothetical protein